MIWSLQLKQKEFILIVKQFNSSILSPRDGIDDYKYANETIIKEVTTKLNESMAK